MKRLWLALGFCLLAGPAFAACPTPLTGKDGGGTTQNFGVTVDGSGNCYGNVGVVDGTAAANKLTVTAAGAAKVDGSAVTQPASIATWASGTLGAMANYGTSPGAVLVPGVNAFVTNALSSVNDTAGGIAGATPFGTPVVPHPYTWDSVNSVWNQARYNGDIVAVPSANFTRPANTTAYAAGQLVANSTTAGSVTPMSWTVAGVNGGGIYVRRFKMTLSSKSITLTSFRLHLFTVTPATITNGDGGAFNVTEANEFCTLDALVSATDPLNWQAGADVSIGYGVPGKGNECNTTVAGGAKTIFGLLEARAAYAPASGETITVVPEIHQTN